MKRPKKHFDAFASREEFFKAFDYYRPNVYGFIKMKTANCQAVGDIFNEVFLKADEKFAAFRGGCFLDWLFLVCRSVIHNVFEKEKRRPTEYIQDFPEWNVADKIQERGFDRVRDQVFLDYALSFVNEDTATALRLYGDNSIQEIADELDLPFTTIKSRVLRGQRLIQRAFPELVAA